MSTSIAGQEVTATAAAQLEALRERLKDRAKKFYNIGLQHDKRSQPLGTMTFMHSALSATTLYACTFGLTSADSELLEIQGKAAEYYNMLRKSPDVVNFQLRKAVLDGGGSGSGSGGGGSSGGDPYGFGEIDPTCPAPKMPNLRFRDIIGACANKRMLRESFVMPVLYPGLFPKGVARGFLFYGPPGTGKTQLVKAACRELHLNVENAGKIYFFEESAAGIKGKYVGETEKNIRRLFACGRKAVGEYEAAHPSKKAVSVLFVDEVDSIAGNRTGDDPYMKNSVNQLLREMEGFNDEYPVSFVCATNYPWTVDAAVVRRLDRQVFIDLPMIRDLWAFCRQHLHRFCDKYVKHVYQRKDIPAVTKAEKVPDVDVSKTDIDSYEDSPLEIPGLSYNRAYIKTVLGLDKVNVDDALLAASCYMRAYGYSMSDAQQVMADIERQMGVESMHRIFTCILLPRSDADVEEGTTLETLWKSALEESSVNLVPVWVPWFPTGTLAKAWKKTMKAIVSSDENDLQRNLEKTLNGNGFKRLQALIKRDYAVFSLQPEMEQLTLSVPLNDAGEIDGAAEAKDVLLTADESLEDVPEYVTMMAGLANHDVALLQGSDTIVLVVTESKGEEGKWSDVTAALKGGNAWVSAHSHNVSPRTFEESTDLGGKRDWLGPKYKELTDDELKIELNKPENKHLKHVADAWESLNKFTRPAARREEVKLRKIAVKEPPEMAKDLDEWIDNLEGTAEKARPEAEKARAEAEEAKATVSTEEAKASVDVTLFIPRHASRVPGFIRPRLAALTLPKELLGERLGLRTDLKPDVEDVKTTVSPQGEFSGWKSSMHRGTTLRFEDYWRMLMYQVKPERFRPEDMRRPLPPKTSKGCRWALGYPALCVAQALQAGGDNVLARKVNNEVMKSTDIDWKQKNDGTEHGRSKDAWDVTRENVEDVLVHEEEDFAARIAALYEIHDEIMMAPSEE